MEVAIQQLHREVECRAHKKYQSKSVENKILDMFPKLFQVTEIFVLILKCSAVLDFEFMGSANYDATNLTQ